MYVTCSWLAPNGTAELKLADGKVCAQLKLNNMVSLYGELQAFGSSLVRQRRALRCHALLKKRLPC